MRDPANASYPCPCCGGSSSKRSLGSYDICALCGWEDDLSQLRFPTTSGANRASLIDAQRVALSRVEEDRSGFDPASLGYRPEPRWRPLDPTVDVIEVAVPGRDYGHSYVPDATEYYYWRRSASAP